MLKREYGAESNGKLLHLFVPSKTAILVPEFAVEDLSLNRTVALVPDFAVKKSTLEQNTLMILVHRKADHMCVKYVQSSVWHP